MTSSTTKANEYGENQRVEFIDIAKGLSIALVVIYHSRLWQSAPELLSAVGLFRLPLFFFVAGIFFSYTQAPSALIRRRFDALLKPYFVTLSLAFLVQALWQGVPFVGLAIKMMYGTRLGKGWFPAWFLTHLFLVCVSAYFVFHALALGRRPSLVRWTLLVVMLVTGAALLNLGPRPRHPSPLYDDVILLGLPWGLDLILVTTPFFLAGSFLKPSIVRWGRTPPLLVIMAIVVLLGIAWKTDATTNLYAGIYSNVILCTVAAACGIFLMLTLARTLVPFRGVSDALRVAGQSGLFILLFHRVTELAFLRIARVLSLERSWGLYLVSFLLSLAVPVAMRFLARRFSVTRMLYFPWHARRANGTGPKQASQ